MKSLDIESLLADIAKDLDPIPLPETQRPTHRVLVVFHTFCACGEDFFSPGAKNLLLRTTNSRTGAVHEHEFSSADEYSNLPIETRILSSSVNVCQRCVK
jgi:hypothetical protein